MNKLRERIRVLMKSPDYSPLNKSEFARTLRLKPHERSELRAELKAIRNTTKIDVTVSLGEKIKTQETVLT